MIATGPIPSWFVQVACQTCFCLGLGMWMARRFQRRPARAHFIMILALVVALAAPLASLAIGRLNWGIFPGSPDATEFWLSSENAPHATWAGAALFGGVLLTVWLIVSLTLLAGILIGYARGRRLISRTAPVVNLRFEAAASAALTKVRLRTAPELRFHEEAPTPMVWAWRHVPIAVIPEEALCCQDDVDWESIFIHEFAHLARRDHLTSLMADISVAFLWWNPLAWHVRSEIARQSEYACDDRVVNAGKSTVEYAASLLALRRESLIPAIPATTLSGHRRWLKVRVSRLLQMSEPVGTSIGPAWTSGVILLASALVTSLALAQVHLTPRPEDSFAAPLPRQTNLNQRDATSQ